MNGTVDIVASVPDAFANLVAARLAGPRDRRFSLFLSGGQTARQSYERLAERTAPGADGGAGDRVPVEWTTVDIYLGDERCVPPEDEDSNHRLITEALLDVVGPVGSDHPMYRSGPPEAAAAAYQSEIQPLGGFDLVHLGIGPDGHCASLFPGSDALAIDDPTVLVAANRDPLANNPHDRITLTLPGIARARTVVFTVSGPSRTEAFARVVAGEDLPAGRVAAGEVLWLVDTEAAADAQLPG